MPKYEVGNSKYVVEGVIKELADGADLQRVMDGHGLSAVQVMNMMGSKRGRDLLKARKKLSRIHSELVANRFSAFAVQKLCAVLQEKKPELWLKAAVAVLEAAKGEKRLARKGERGKVEEEMAFEPERAERMMRAVVQVMAAMAEEEKGLGKEN